ncbi:MAG: aminodeoxychorismate synthase, component I [Chloroflexi bacterium HGW-Chloroflexi-10]|nr:MAG: aminodeoxychorismate synthase, component I [Chloroflexi bacterium HGW-Chloroflexi-10]
MPDSSVASSNRLPRVILKDAAAACWLVFSRPCQTWRINRLEDVLPALEDIEKQVTRKNAYAAGFVSYEAAPAFDPNLEVYAPGSFPLLWFGLFDAPEIRRELPPPLTNTLTSLDWKPSITPAEYASAFNLIKENIARGQTYQVNFTHHLHSRIPFPPEDIFAQLVANHNQPYSAFVELEDWAVCSASPELFFRLSGETIESLPMKGTAARGLWPQQDQAQAQYLLQSEKERAENVMIVDMVRNDFGRIARTGTVTVPELFRTERYPTVWQMVSLVRAETSASLAEIFQATFPPASITGAPKKSTMQIIRTVEKNPRRIYTGAIGMLKPGRQAQFNVAIRTILINKTNQQAEYGLGGAIVWDSDCELEQEECRIKARVLSRQPLIFDLLESLRWDEQHGFWLLEEHLQRLAQSAAYFGYTCDIPRITSCLENFVQALSNTHKIRLLLNRQGDIHIESERIEVITSAEPLRVCLAKQPVNTNNVFLYHKTTHREVYDQARAAQPDANDIILYNQFGQVTESCRANLMIEIHGQCYTPPIQCGLLGGTLRARLIKEQSLSERIITLEEVHNTDQIWLFNSVRGIWPVILKNNGAA